MRIRTKLMALLAAAGLTAGAASAQTAPAGAPAFPTKTVRLIVPFAPGGATDYMARTIAQKMSENLGQPVIVDNRPGANAVLGTDAVAKAAPDGHTLLMATSSLAIDVGGGRKMSFDPRKDLVPVAPVADTNNVVIVPADSPIRSIATLIEAAKAKPGELAYGTPGIGSPAHLFAELFAQMADVRMLHVPYSRSPAMNDLIGGRLAVMFATIPAATPQIRNGKARPLAVTGAQRFPTMPDVPTVAASGLPGYDAGQWLGVFAPAGTPGEIVQRLNAEIAKAVTSAQTAQQLHDRGMIPLTATPAEFAKRFADDVAKWGAVMRSADIRLE